MINYAINHSDFFSIFLSIFTFILLIIVIIGYLLKNKINLKEIRFGKLKLSFYNIENNNIENNNNKYINENYNSKIVDNFCHSINYKKDKYLTIIKQLNLELSFYKNEYITVTETVQDSLNKIDLSFLKEIKISFLENGLLHIENYSNYIDKKINIFIKKTISDIKNNEEIVKLLKLTDDEIQNLVENIYKKKLYLYFKNLYFEAKNILQELEKTKEYKKYHDDYKSYKSKIYKKLLIEEIGSKLKFIIQTNEKDEKKLSDFYSRSTEIIDKINSLIVEKHKQFYEYVRANSINKQMDMANEFIKLLTKLFDVEFKSIYIKKRKQKINS